MSSNEWDSVLVRTATVQQGRNPLNTKGQHIISYQMRMFHNKYLAEYSAYYSNLADLLEEASRAASTRNAKTVGLMSP